MYETRGSDRHRRRSRWINRILMAGIITYTTFYVRLLIADVSPQKSSLPNKNDTSTLQNSPKSSVNIEIQSIFDNEPSHRNNKRLSAFSGEYEEIPRIGTRYNGVHKYVIDEILFAVTTNTQRIFTMIDHLKFWMTLPSIICLIIFEEKDFLNLRNITEYLLYEGILCEVETSNVIRYEERYFELFYRAWNRQEAQSDYNTKKKIQWFAVGDDDTIWFINNLLRTLEHYNSSNTIYLGDISTKKSLVARHGTFYAYGGGGVLFSRPLALLFVQHRQECKRFLNVLGGDEMIGKCVTDELKINLTTNNNFHQMDHIGDIIGLMESGIEGLVSLHHMFKLWKPFPDAHINQSNETIHRLSIAYNAFGPNFLKRYLLVNYHTNQSVLLTMGYTISLFNRLLSPTDLSLIEKTWCCDEMVENRTRPQEKNKTTWHFQRLLTEKSNDNPKYEMIYENNVVRSNRYSNIKVTVIN